MARQARMAVGGLPHLVVLRALPGIELVREPGDAEVALSILRRVAGDERLAIHGYGFGAERIAWLTTPEDASALSRLSQGFGRLYVSAYNRRYHRMGTIFDGRFRATVVAPDGHALMALREVESAAGPAGGVGCSSRAHHEGRAREAWLVPLAAYWDLGNTPFDREQRWADHSQEPSSSGWSDRLRQALNGVGALGDEDFVAACRARAGRPMPVRPRGRPTKAQTIR